MISFLTIFFECDECNQQSTHSLGLWMVFPPFFCIMLVTELVSTTWDTHVTLHCGHYSTQTYDAHDWSVASQTLLGPIKIRPVVCKICIEQPILRAKLTSSINYLLYWLRSSVSHILLKNSWRSNALAFSTGKSATQAILLMKNKFLMRE